MRCYQKHLVLMLLLSISVVLPALPTTHWRKHFPWISFFFLFCFVSFSFTHHHFSISQKETYPLERHAEKENRRERGKKHSQHRMVLHYVHIFIFTMSVYSFYGRWQIHRWEMTATKTQINIRKHQFKQSNNILLSELIRISSAIIFNLPDII